MRSRRSGIGVIAYGEHVYAVSLSCTTTKTIPLDFQQQVGLHYHWEAVETFFPIEDSGKGMYEITGPLEEGLLVHRSNG